MLLGAQQPAGTTMASGLLEQIAPEVLPGALAQGASEPDDGDPLDRGDLSRIEVFAMDRVRPRDRSLRAMTAVAR